MYTWARFLAFVSGTAVGMALLIKLWLGIGIGVVVVTVFSFWLQRAAPTDEDPAVAVGKAFLAGVPFGCLVDVVAFIGYLNWACDHRGECL
jgi:hypothetical protein